MLNGSESRTLTANQRGLIREYSSLFKPTFYPCTVFRKPRPLPEGGVTRDNSIVYDFYALAPQVECVRKNRQLSDFYVVIKSLGKLAY